ncbi:hypothetical protein CAEBREN_12034 [Caenorhabditis brenneri]|uniref:Uncharacterized protein n=1 Tax=Caenorhabditis brenneri TaxID=135651 RepID=G0MMQ5_CAEBE|nr:hypothetical protein CAEBREN_12034 [Caenorhabditis brenneri]
MWRSRLKNIREDSPNKGDLSVDIITPCNIETFIASDLVCILLYAFSVHEDSTSRKANSPAHYVSKEALVCLAAQREVLFAHP